MLAPTWYANFIAKHIITSTGAPIRVWNTFVKRSNSSLRSIIPNTRAMRVPTKYDTYIDIAIAIIPISVFIMIICFIFI